MASMKGSDSVLSDRIRDVENKAKSPFKIGEGAALKVPGKDKTTGAINAARYGVEGIVPGGGAHLANPRLLLPSRASSLRCPTPVLCSPNAKFWQGTGIKTARGIHTSSILETASETEHLCSGSNGHPHLVTFENAINYFERGPELVIHVPDINDELYKLVQYNPNEPLMLTEKGKMASRSLVESVATLHDHNLCLPYRLSLGDLSVSSLGTFKLPKMDLVKLTEKGQQDDMACVADVLGEMMITRHHAKVIYHLPSDYKSLLNSLMNPATPRNLIRWHPAHLPATTYCLAFMKLHGLVMENGLRGADPVAAKRLVELLPYLQFAPITWIDIVTRNRFLVQWYRHSRRYFITNPFHILEFGRNVMTGHPLDHRCTAALLLPKGSSPYPYSEEAVCVVFQNALPLLLPDLLELVVLYFDPAVLDRLRLDELFPGVPPYYLLENES